MKNLVMIIKVLYFNKTYNTTQNNCNKNTLKIINNNNKKETIII